MNGPSDISNVVAKLFPTLVAVVACPVGPAWDGPAAAELPLMRGMTATRRQEFLAGRFCARRACSDLGLVTAQGIGKHPDGAPVWPPGVIGSITHSARWAAAAVTTPGHAAGIGLDVEDVTCLSADVERLFLLPVEQGCVNRWEGDERRHWATRFFCAKECVIKALAPKWGKWIGFDAVQITFDRVGDNYAVTLADDLARTARALRLDGRCTVADGHVWAGVTLQKETSVIQI